MRKEAVIPLKHTERRKSKAKSIICNKKGMALENAILFMIIIFSFCALLTSLTLFGHYQAKLDRVLLEKEVAVEQIGEDFLAGETKDNLKKKYGGGGYSCDITESDKVLTVKRNGAVVLYVKKGENNELACWRYSAPDP